MSGLLETLVFHGNCCKLVFQNEASHDLHKLSMVGARFITRSYTLGSGEVVKMVGIRDRVFAGQTVTLYKTRVREHGVDYLLSTIVSPIRDRRGLIVGMQSDGCAVESGAPPPEINLAEWLESLPPTAAQLDGSFRPASTPDSLVDLRVQLAQSLRRIGSPFRA